MDCSQKNANAQAINMAQTTEEKHTPPLAQTEVPKSEVVIAKKKSKSRQGKHASKKSRCQIHDVSESDASGSESGHESEDSSEDEKIKRKKRRKSAAKRAAAKKNQKAETKHKKSRSRKQDSTSEDGTSSDSSDSSSNSDSEADDKKSRRKALRAKAKRKKDKKLDSSGDESASNTSSSYSSDSDSEDEESKRKRAKAKTKRKTKNSKKAESSASSSDSSSSEDELPVVPTSPPVPPLLGDSLDTQVTKVSRLLSSLKTQQASLNAAAAAVSTTKLEKPVKKNGLEFKRVDQVFDMKIHDWKLVESNADLKDEFDCVFTVRRQLNWEGKYQETQLDIKSKLLRNALRDAFKDCRSVSLVEEIPQIDAHTLFHYYDELKAYIKKTLKPKLRKKKKSKEQKRLKQQIAQCKLLLSYVDEDYTATRKALRPMLKAGTITYDLVWALFKPNTIAFTPTYHNKDDPRCFKVETAYEYESWMTGIKSWYVDGKYLEYDGKSFGLGDHQITIQAFKGHKKITSLSAYPLKYHKDPEVSN